MAWYTDLKNKVLPLSGYMGKSIYRIIPFDVLLSMISEKKNVLVKTKKWEDAYENFLFKENFVVNGNQWSISSLQEQLYGQCWTLRKSSDAMWRIYSSNKKSVRIRSTVGALWDSINNCTDGKCLMGEVQYFPQAQICDDLVNGAPYSIDSLTDLLIYSQFVKRNSFSHEAEYRAIFFADNTSDSDVQEFDIDPFDFIKSIYFDPRADDAYVARCKKILTTVFKFPAKRISKSTLYQFKPSTLLVQLQ